MGGATSLGLQSTARFATQPARLGECCRRAVGTAQPPLGSPCLAAVLPRAEASSRPGPSSQTAGSWAARLHPPPSSPGAETTAKPCKPQLCPADGFNTPFLLSRQSRPPSPRGQMPHCFSYPAGGFHHLEVHGVPDGLRPQQRDGVAGGQGIEQGAAGQVAWLVDDRHETVVLQRDHSPDIQPFLRERPGLGGRSSGSGPASELETAARRRPKLTLSKQTRRILPHRLMRGGLMQKMPCFFSLFWA